MTAARASSSVESEINVELESRVEFEICWKLETNAEFEMRIALETVFANKNGYLSLLSSGMDFKTSVEFEIPWN